MRRAWPVFLLLAGGLAFLASLYMPWQEASCGPRCGDGGDVFGLLNLFPEGLSIDGWSSGIGDAAALVALSLAGGAIAALVRPNLTKRLPLGLSALVASYFAFAVAAQSRSFGNQRQVGLTGIDFHYAYGAYLGVAGGVVALLAAAALRRGELARERSASRAAALVLGLALLVSFLLPWQRIGGQQPIKFLGIESPAAVLAAVAACLAVASWTSRSSVGERLGVSATTALFTGAAVGAVTLGASRAYGAWLALGLALALVLIAVFGAPSVVRLVRLSSQAVATAAAAALLVAAFFLPWQKVCYPSSADLGPYAGRCVSTDAWVTIAGSAAAPLAMMVLVMSLGWRRLHTQVVELVAGIALLVATLGFEVAAPDLPGFRVGYGAIVGFSAAAVLMVLAVARLRPGPLDRTRLLLRVVPMAACLAYLVIVVVPWWDVLPGRVQAQSFARFSSPSWLTVAGVLLALHLLTSWARRIAVPGESAYPLVLLPLALLALAAAELVRFRDVGITWGGGLVVGLCIVLAVLGGIEQREGLESFRVPELLRVDRL
ncbi:MAG TPA: hypothetical protein VF101_08485 [Gaiellaceae bacterium]